MIQSRQWRVIGPKRRVDAQKADYSCRYSSGLSPDSLSHQNVSCRAAYSATRDSSVTKFAAKVHYLFFTAK